MSIVEYVDHMGTDNSVVDAARVSFDKVSFAYSDNQNEKLISYLAEHNHWSPFSHCFISMRFKAPVFIARQLAKHQVGFSWNEVSRRYVTSDISFWIPEYLRQNCANKKQGSSLDEVVDNAKLMRQYLKLQLDCKALYEKMIESDVCGEQARMILPQSMMTEWIWSGSLYAWSRMYKLRSHDGVQLETSLYAKEVGKICKERFPICWKYLEIQ